MADRVSSVERPLTFGPDQGLIGIWCEPRGAPAAARLPVVVFINSGVIHRAGIGRLHVRLARALAESGFSSLRFDLSGIGDSARPRDAIPLAEIVSRDVHAAVAIAKSRGNTDGVILAGLCTGARDAIDGALGDPSVVGVVAIDVIGDLRNWQFWAVHLGRRILRLESWVNTINGRNRWVTRVLGRWAPGSRNGAPTALPRDMVLGIRDHLSREALGVQLDQLLARGAGVFFAFSGGEGNPYNHERQLAEIYPEAVRHRGLAWAYFPEADHIFSERAQQAHLIERIKGWLAAEFLTTGDVGDDAPLPLSKLA